MRQAESVWTSPLSIPEPFLGSLPSSGTTISADPAASRPKTNSWGLPLFPAILDSSVSVEARPGGHWIWSRVRASAGAEMAGAGSPPALSSSRTMATAFLL